MANRNYVHELSKFLKENVMSSPQEQHFETIVYLKINKFLSDNNLVITTKWD